MLKVAALPAFDDNYIWALSQEGGDALVVVDPGDAEPVAEYLDRTGLRLVAILLTHRHSDHTGGVKELKASWPQAPVYGPAHEMITQVSHPLADGAQVELPELGANFQVLELPGHTEGHIAYWGQGMLFCGDVLFTGGCGRVFTGTYEQMSHSLLRLGALPPETLVYCAHEYTLGNLGFAKLVEPSNEALMARLAQTHELRKKHKATVPAPLALELATNPFMRTRVPAVIAAAEHWSGRALNSPAQVFHALRDWKDRNYD